MHAHSYPLLLLMYESGSHLHGAGGGDVVVGCGWCRIYPLQALATLSNSVEFGFACSQLTAASRTSISRLATLLCKHTTLEILVEVSLLFGWKHRAPQQ